MGLIYVLHAMLKTLAAYQLKQAKRTRPSGQDQADKTKRIKPSKAKQAGANGKELAVFSRNSSRRPVSFFCAKAPTNHLFAKCVGEEQ